MSKERREEGRERGRGREGSKEGLIGWLCQEPNRGKVYGNLQVITSRVDIYLCVCFCSARIEPGASSMLDKHTTIEPYSQLC